MLEPDACVDHAEELTMEQEPSPAVSAGRQPQDVDNEQKEDDSSLITDETPLTSDAIETVDNNKLVAEDLNDMPALNKEKDIQVSGELAVASEPVSENAGPQLEDAESTESLVDTESLQVSTNDEFNFQIEAETDLTHDDTHEQSSPCFDKNSDAVHLKTNASESMEETSHVLHLSDDIFPDSVTPESKVLLKNESIDCTQNIKALNESVETSATELNTNDIDQRESLNITEEDLVLKSNEESELGMEKGNSRAAASKHPSCLTITSTPVQKVSRPIVDSQDHAENEMQTSHMFGNENSEHEDISASISENVSVVRNSSHSGSNNDTEDITSQDCEQSSADPENFSFKINEIKNTWLPEQIVDNTDASTADTADSLVIDSADASSIADVATSSLIDNDEINCSASVANGLSHTYNDGEEMNLDGDTTANGYEDENKCTSKKRKLESGHLDEDFDVSESSEVPSKKSKRPLPRCRMTRTYLCEYCNLTTQNPRDHLYHIRDSHGEPIHIYECDKCQYASKNFTKLMRHMQMVHKMNMNEVDENGSKVKLKQSKYRAPPSSNPDVQLLMAANKKSPKPAAAKSPRSVDESESFLEEYDDELEDEEMLLMSDLSLRRDGQTWQCDQCDYTCRSRKHLSKHSRSRHLKQTFYRCSKCNYVTHLKGRYTKHMKYHQLPIIKCEFCDFRTPYRWNLDRHAKNHIEEGEFKCHLCNFSAQIKQSLTVHVANHHLTPDQIRARELRRTIGISDPQDYGSDEEEMEMMKLERDEHPDAFQLADGQSFTVSNADVSGQEDGAVGGADDSDVAGEPKKKKPKIKLTFKKMKTSKESSTTQDINERHNFGEDFIHPDDLVHRNGNVYIKNYKCDQCHFKAAFRSDLIRHAKKVHHLVHFEEGIQKKLPKLVKHASSGNTSNASSDIDLNNDDSTMEESDMKETSLDSSCDVNDDNLYNRSRVTDNKRKASHPDDSYEKQPGAQNFVCQFCGHNSKCLSESVRHQKLHSSAKSISSSTSLSNHCQFCKHRCKSTVDLVSHLKHCTQARKNQIIDSTSTTRASVEREVNSEDNEDSRDSGALEVDTRSRSSSRHSSDTETFNKRLRKNSGSEGKGDQSLKISTNNSTLPCTSKGDIEKKSVSSDGKSHSYTKRVYRCPQCKFWSTTASRFHVHIVGHFNKKPYVCSECNYRSNWRWDITKHIKIRVARDGTHKTADVVITDETGEKNYEKYENYVTVIQLDENLSSRTEGGLPARKGRHKKSPENEAKVSPETSSKTLPSTLKVDPSQTPANPHTTTLQPPTLSQPMVKIPISGTLPSLPRLLKAPVSSCLNALKLTIPSPSSVQQTTTLSNPSSGSSRSSSVSPRVSPNNTSSSSNNNNIISAFKSPGEQQVKCSMKPPPLVALRGVTQVSSPLPTAPTGAQYQIITPQVGANTLSCVSPAHLEGLCFLHLILKCIF